MWEFNSSEMYKVTNLGKSGRRFSAGQCVPKGLNILVTQAAATRSPSAIMFERAKDGIRRRVTIAHLAKFFWSAKLRKPIILAKPPKREEK